MRLSFLFIGSEIGSYVGVESGDFLKLYFITGLRLCKLFVC